MLSRRRLLGLLPGAALALREMRGEAAKRRHMKQRWDHRKVIVVENRAGKEWNEGVEFVVREWHRAFPRLRFKVIHQPKKRCNTRRGAIVICDAPFNPWYGGFTWTRRRKNPKHEILSANVRIVRTGAGRVFEVDGLTAEMGTWNAHLSMMDVHNLCHELGHAIGLEHYAAWRDSCLGWPTPGSVTDPAAISIRPGAYDAESLRLLYTRKGPGWP